MTSRTDMIEIIWHANQIGNSASAAYWLACNDVSITHHVEQIRSAYEAIGKLIAAFDEASK